MKQPRCLHLIVCLLLLCCSWAERLPAAGHDIPDEEHQSLHDVYLANTEHELHVFRIYGKKPGKTIMLIGGIQGDEPGGYLTADLYADITLKQGNLIVVPRANFYSILLNQRDGLTGDMNRKFGDKEATEKSMEQEIVTILKKLIGEADCLLNLHEGSGFFNPTFVDDNENPDKFGQSIIFDAADYRPEQSDKVIDLAGLAAKITDRVNSQIENPRYHFRCNNHDTTASDTRHPEQRKSATFYALTRAHIPAFGVETSKSIRAIGEKVSLQKLVVNSFMEEFGILPDTPGQRMEPTQLDYVLVKVNNGLPYAVPSGPKVEVQPGDQVVITDIIANFDRGLAADFLEMGSYNDTRLPFRIGKKTKVVIRKDAETCGFVDIVLKPQTATAGASGTTPAVAVATAPLSEANRNEMTHEKTKVAPAQQTTVTAKPGKPKPVPVLQPVLTQLSPNAPAAVPATQNALPVSQLKAETLLIHVNNKLHMVKEGGEIAVPPNRVLIIKGIQSNISRLDPEIAANLKGFAPPKNSNDGNDINFPVFPKQDLWVRYSENKKGFRYPIIATYQDKEIGIFWIRLNK